MKRIHSLIQKWRLTGFFNLKSVFLRIIIKLKQIETRILYHWFQTATYNLTVVNSSSGYETFVQEQVAQGKLSNPRRQ